MKIRKTTRRIRFTGGGPADGHAQKVGTDRDTSAWIFGHGIGVAIYVELGTTGEMVFDGFYLPSENEKPRA